MAAWSQSPFLQALGWAMLNSLWQMALLYALVSVFQGLFSLSALRRYYISIVSLGAGLLWFAITFFLFYKAGAVGTIVAQHQLAPNAQTWNRILSAASLTYLFLLAIPVYRLVQNWCYIEQLKKFGLQKTAMEYRLFVKNVAQRLGIKHTVQVYLSQLVQSPVTVGYLKPIILLPIAAINNLSPKQVEAVLLHELSHIRRYDYLINFIIILLQTLFYFNPFVKKFVSLIEFEREKCCDELVLQFQYDKVSYASALLLLEKSVLASEALTLAAAGKSHLLGRIEKILGMQKKRAFSFQQLAGLAASFLVVLLINSLLFVDKEVKLKTAPVFAAFENPLYQFETPAKKSTFSNTHVPVTAVNMKSSAHTVKNQAVAVAETASQFEPAESFNLTPVAFDLVDEKVTAEEKARIQQTLDKTKKVLTSSKWKELEASIGDGMTASEKQVAKQEYLKAVENIKWKLLESHMKSEYDYLNWPEITGKLNGAIAELQLDSLQVSYRQILTEIKNAQEQSSKTAAVPVPDLSVKEVNALKLELKCKIDSIQVVRDRKIINF